MGHSQIVAFIWGVADLIKDYIKHGEFQKVILPFTVLRRLDCVLAPTRDKVRKINAKYKAQDLQNRTPQLRRASGFAFYNTSPYDFERLHDDSPNLAVNLRNYIAGFSDNMRDALRHFGFDEIIGRLDEHGLLFKVLESFRKIDLHPGTVSNAQMGMIFEELLRKFNEASNENPGEHFTPRDVVHLMADLMLAGDKARIRREGAVLTVCDPCCGTGGMLTIAREHIVGKNGGGGLNPSAQVHLFGQEVNPDTYAICKSDLMMILRDGRDADNIGRGSTLRRDEHSKARFDYLISNPPYGKDWNQDKEAVVAEYERGGGRFAAGLPRISDGQTLFLQHIIAKMKPPSEGGARAALIMNGSPLFTGDAGGGESEIRRYVLEHDLLEALVALPEQMFYNTGIATYIWVLSNRKERRRRGKVQLIDARRKWKSLRRSLGDKRREIPPDLREEIVAELGAFAESATCKIFPASHFGYRKITVERPLRLNFRASAERIARLDKEAAFGKLAQSKKKGAAAKREMAAGEARQEEIRDMLAALPAKLYRDRAGFAAALDKAMGAAKMALSAPFYKAVLAALSERDPTAEICRDRDGRPEPDPKLRDAERVALSETIAAFFKREVTPHLPDAWIDESRRDRKDGKVGIVGYEINFNRYFYNYTPPRPPTEIMRDFRKVEKEIAEMTADLSAARAGRDSQRAMKDSGVDWLGEIPADWNIHRAGGYLREVNEFSVSGEETLLSVSEYTGVRPRQESLSEDEHLTRAASLEGYKRYAAGDLVMNIMLAWKCGQGIAPVAGIVSPAYAVFRIISKKLNAHYLHYLCRASLMVSVFGAHSYGIIPSRWRLYPEVFLRLPLLLPPTIEQRAIAAFLDAQTAKIDAVILKKERQIELLRELRASVITDAVTKGLNPQAPMKDSGVQWLGKIPVNWVVTRLKYLPVQFFTGGTPDSGNSQFWSSDEGDIPWVAISDMTKNQNIRQTTKNITAEGLASKDMEIAPPGTLLYSMFASLGKVSFLDICAAFNQAILGIKSDERKLSKEYLAYWLFCIEKHVAIYSSRSTQDNLNAQKVKNFPVIVPPVNEQRIIAASLDAQTAKIDRAIAKAQQSITLLREYRAALIDAAVTGKIDAVV